MLRAALRSGLKASGGIPMVLERSVVTNLQDFASKSRGLCNHPARLQRSGSKASDRFGVARKPRCGLVESSRARSGVITRRRLTHALDGGRPCESSIGIALRKLEEACSVYAPSLSRRVPESLRRRGQTRTTNPRQRRPAARRDHGGESSKRKRC